MAHKPDGLNWGAISFFVPFSWVGYDCVILLVCGLSTDHVCLQLCLRRFAADSFLVSILRPCGFVWIVRFAEEQ